MTTNVNIRTVEISIIGTLILLVQYLSTGSMNGFEVQLFSYAIPILYAVESVINSGTITPSNNSTGVKL